MPRLLTSLSCRLMRRRAPESEVSIRRVFVLPTRHGLMVALAILGVFAIAVRIQNNMLLLMAVALFVIFTLSLLWAGQNIRGLKLSVRHDGRIIAGETSMLSVRLAAMRPAYDIRIDSGGGLQRAGEAVDHLLSFSPDRRGRHPRPLERIETAIPFGLARAWSWISPAQILSRRCRTMRRRAPTDRNPTRAPLRREEDGADSLQDWIPGRRRADQLETLCRHRRAAREDGRRLGRRGAEHQL